MKWGIAIPAVFLVGFVAFSTRAQTKALVPQMTVPLTVPSGTGLQVVLDQDTKVHNLGQPIHGRVAEPVYAFDKLVIPVGAQVNGRITGLEGLSGRRRFLRALDADFTPSRKVDLEFDDVELSDGVRIPIHAVVTQGSGQVIRFVTSSESDKNRGIKGAAVGKTQQAKQEARRDWDAAMKQVREPGKIRKAEKYVFEQSPVHPQYLDRGTVYFVELNEPLDFGSEPLSPDTAASINTPPPPGSVVRARLVTEMNSAVSQKGDDVEAILSEPLFDGQRLLLPQGCRLKGSVVQAQPARHFSHNGQLRIVFHEIVLPDGVEQKIEANLEGVQSAAQQDVKLDSEGGAEAATPRARYLSTGLSIALAMAAGHTDDDAGAGRVSGDATNRVAGGAVGFKLVGIALGVFVHSQPLGMAMGAYGASMSVYEHFIARGRDVIFPKNTAMEIGVSPRIAGADPTGRH